MVPSKFTAGLLPQLNLFGNVLTEIKRCLSQTPLVIINSASYQSNHHTDCTPSQQPDSVHSALCLPVIQVETSVLEYPLFLITVRQWDFPAKHHGKCNVWPMLRTVCGGCTCTFESKGWISGVFLLSFWKHGISMNLELTCLTRPADHGALEIHLSPPLPIAALGLQVCATIPSFVGWCWESELLSS